ncbi:hypothetical protein BDF20DRAFT_841160 [Mycotypha africana]|uniref:uncharacterized protein n=1 Tax=Mycotypha africana TaxID=64632 RepID=UPI002300292D|nr:uncharacterized protein BDF20DRAFT_841160 [Mycotypha africana]KAI8990843.1 hypothetical protein BDF20DRAFT_841160 [Mycotypha africana]
MSTLIRTNFRKILSNPSLHIAKRQAHKKASIQVRLNDYVEGIGIKGEIVTIRPGMMRNLLYPNGKASYIVKGDTSSNVSLENESVTKAEAEEDMNAKLRRMMKASAEVEEITNKLNTIQEVVFTRAVVPNSVHTFGSVTAEDLVSKLKEQFGLTIDRSSIDFKSEGGRIKSLGKHKVSVQVTGGQMIDISVIVNAAAAAA